MRAAPARGVAGSVLMTVGGFCYVRMPRHTWVDHVPALWAARQSAHHLTWGLALSTAGLALLTWAWWDLRRDVRGDPAGLGRVRRATGAWAAPLLLAPPLFSGDGWSYVATGDLAGRGLSPYLWTPAALPPPLSSGVSPRWLFTPSPYGPLSLSWGAAFSHLTHDPWVLLGCYRLAAVLSLALLAWVVPVLARRVGRDPVDASALVVASPFVLAHGIGGLHNDLWVAALMLAALAVTRRGVWLPGALLVGAAAAVKVPGAVAAVGVVLLSLDTGAGLPGRLRRTAAVGAVAGFVVLAAGWLTGLGTGWVGGLMVPDREHTLLAFTSVLGRWIHTSLMHAGPAGVRVVRDTHPETLAKQVGLGLLLLTAGWVLLVRRLGSRRRRLAGVGLVLLAAVVFSPVVHFWYFLWCVPVLVCLPLRRAGHAALVAGIIVLGLTAPADPALHLRWMAEAAAWALVLVPATAWGVTTLWERNRRPVSEPGSC